MNNCPLYTGQNLNFTGNSNPYELIQRAGKRRKRKTNRRKRKGDKTRLRKTRKYRH
jgi:hypothetical protein